MRARDGAGVSVGQGVGDAGDARPRAGSARPRRVGRVLAPGARREPASRASRGAREKRFKRRARDGGFPPARCFVGSAAEGKSDPPDPPFDASRLDPGASASRATDPSGRGARAAPPNHRAAKEPREAHVGAGKGVRKSVRRARAPRTSRRAPTRSARIRSPSARRRFAATRVDRPMCVRRSPRARRRKWRARAGMPVARCGKALPFRSREAALSRSRGSQIRGVSARDFRGVEIANRETPRRVETDGADRHLSVTGQRPRLIDPLYAFKQRSPRGFPETRSSGLTPPIEPAIDRSGATVRRSDASRTADFFAPPAITANRETEPPVGSAAIPGRDEIDRAFVIRCHPDQSDRRGGSKPRERTMGTRRRKVDASARQPTAPGKQAFFFSSSRGGVSHHHTHLKLRKTAKPGCRRTF